MQQVSLHQWVTTVTCADRFSEISAFAIMLQKWREVGYGGGQRRTLVNHDGSDPQRAIEREGGTPCFSARTPPDSTTRAA